MSKLLRLSVLASVGALCALVTAGCGSTTHATSSTDPKTGSSATASGTLTETGSTLLYPLFNLWGPAYAKTNPGVHLTTAGTGSGTGISQAAAGAVELGASDAYLSSSDLSTYPGLLNIPLAISAQQINYNLPALAAGTHVKLDGQVLAGMYQGAITKWNAAPIAALNPGVKLPATTVVPLHRSDSSGDTFLFSSYLSKQDAAWSSKIGYGTDIAFPNVAGALGESSNGAMVTGCKATPGCVAYIGISYLQKTKAAGLGEARLANGSGSYELPTAASIGAEVDAFSGQEPASGALSLIDSSSAASGYPIINFEYAIVQKSQSSSAKAGLIKNFLTWAINPSAGNSASYLGQVQFQPLPSSARTISTTLINAIG